MSEPVTNTPVGGGFTLRDLISHICTPQPSKHLQEMYDFTWDVNVLALTLDGEGRSQNILGRAAIAWTVKNRQLGLGPIADKDKSVSEICLRRLQYSTWFELGGKDNYDRQMRLAEFVVNVGTDRPMGTATPPWWPKFEESRYIAAGVIKGYLLDPTGGSAHYLTTALYKSNPPRWVSQATGAKEIGDHIFLKGIR